MPNYRGHLMGGVVAFGLVAYCLSVTPTVATLIEWLIFTLAGALFPDVDIKSKGQLFLYRFLLLVFLMLILQNRLQQLAFLSVAALVPMLVKHRGLFHRVWFILLFPAVLAVSIAGYCPHYAHIIYYDALFFIAGALSHLVLDLGLRRMFRL